MLASTFTRSAAKITVTVNGHALEAKKGESILSLCTRNGIRVPRLCYHPCLPLQGSCGLCVVHINNQGTESFANACVTKVQNGIRVNTLHQKVVDQVRSNLQKILDFHDERCSSCIANKKCEFRNLCFENKVSTIKDRREIKYPVDNSTFSIRMDPSKCVDCKRCVRACKSITGLKILKVAPFKWREAVQTNSGLSLDETQCIRCGQCVLYCPVGALTEHSQSREVLSDLRNHERKLNVCQLSPSVHIVLADALGISPKELTQGKLISALRALGFDLVLDTKLAGDLLVMEEAANLVDKIKSNKLNAPYFLSACPSFINYIEQTRSALIPNCSTARSPPSILGSLVREVIPQKKDISSRDIYNVSITTCLSKKDEIERPQYLTKEGMKNIDVNLTVRELVDILHIAHVNVLNFKESEFDNLLGNGSGAASLLDASGGLMESVLRTAEWMMTGKNPKTLEIKQLRGDKSLKVYEANISGNKVKIAAVQGMADAIKFFDKLKKDKNLRQIKYVEVMTCPGGCVCGGGTPMLQDKKNITDRMNEIYNEEKKAKIRLSHENPDVQAIYQNLLGEPNSRKAHELIHTHFNHRPGF